jgi:hypothetical protein
MILSNEDLARKLDALERKLQSHDVHIRSLFEAIRQLMAPPEPKKRRIEFLVEERPPHTGEGSCRQNLVAATRKHESRFQAGIVLNDLNGGKRLNVLNCLNGRQC